jgi:hypothetical protein
VWRKEKRRRLRPPFIGGVVGGVAWSSKPIQCSRALVDLTSHIFSSLWAVDPFEIIAALAIDPSHCITERLSRVDSLKITS